MWTTIVNLDGQRDTVRRDTFPDTLTTKERVPGRRKLRQRIAAVALSAVTMNSLLTGGYRAESRLPEGRYHRIVAMGDSYGAGTGSSSIDKRTLEPGVNECARGKSAPAELLANEAHVKFYNIACAQLTPDGLTRPQWNEPSQTDQVKDIDPDLVILSLGGNQISLSDFAAACLETGCGPHSKIAAEMSAKLSSPEFGQTLVDDFEAVLAAAPNAEVYVTGYPAIIKWRRECSMAASALNQAGVSYADVLTQSNVKTITHVISSINATVERSAEEVQAHNHTRTIAYVPPRQNVDVCYGLNLIDPKFVYFPEATNPLAQAHPNDDGNEIEASAIAAVIADDRKSG